MECCTGQTECNRIVTIGYLKNFIGDNIKTSDGGTAHVPSSYDDSYVPTYHELTSGTLIPNYVDGGSSNWGDSVDGITVNGNYLSGEAVKQTDLILTYVRVKIVDLALANTSFSECGESSSYSVSAKFLKTVKAMNDCIADEYSTESPEESIEAVLTSSEDWAEINEGEIYVEKNGTWSSDTRSAVITATFTYKGVEYTSSKTISQSPLSGSYVFDEKEPYEVIIDEHDGPVFNTCNAVDFSASATGYYRNRLKWVDSCGTSYGYNYTYEEGSENAGTVLGHFNEVLCPTETYSAETSLTITYSGITSEPVTFYQICSQQCGECNSYTTYGSGNYSGTVGMCGGNMTISADVASTIHNKEWVGSECVETTTPTSYTQTATISIEPNETQSGKTISGSVLTLEGGTIHYTIEQDAGPCNGCHYEGSTTVWGNTSIEVGNCAKEASVTLSGITTSAFTNCADVSSAVTTSTTVTFSVNNTSSPRTITKTYETASITIYQAAGPCPDSCLCSKLTVHGTVDVPASGGAGILVGTYNQDTCLSGLNASFSSNWITNLTMSNGNIFGNVSANTNTESNRTALVIVTGMSEVGSCEKSFEVTQSQSSLTCTCDNLVITPISTQLSNSGGNLLLCYYNEDTCVTDITASSDEPWIANASVYRNHITATVESNDSVSARTATITVSSLTESGTCTNEFTVTQSPTCTCDDLIVDLYTIPSSGVGTNETIGLYYIECTDDSLISGEIKYNGSHVSDVTFSNGNITINGSIGENEETSFKEYTLLVKYDGVSCTPYTLSQEGQEVQCSCSAISYFVDSVNTTFSLSGSNGQEVMIASADTYGCGSLSAKTNLGTVFVNDTLREVISPNGHYYYWYATVKQVSADTTSTINIYYADRDKKSFDEDCKMSVSVWCLSNFYTCDLITSKPALVYNGYYDDNYCVYVDNWEVSHSLIESDGQSVTFVPRLISEITSPYPQLAIADRMYSSITVNDSDIELNRVTIKKTTSASGNIILRDYNTPLITIYNASEERKVYFAVDVYVNGVLCPTLTREGIYVGNESVSTLTKCDVIEKYLQKTSKTTERYESDSYENWSGGIFGGEKCNVYYQTCGTGYNCLKSAPSGFTYNQNGSDVLGDDNWQEIPFGCVFKGKTYAQMLSASTNSCVQGTHLSFDGSLMPQLKISEPSSLPSHYEFESDGNGGYTGRVRLISGDTSSSYINEEVVFSNQSDYNKSLKFADEEESFSCSASSRTYLRVYLRAKKDTSYVDELNYSSCSDLERDLTISTYSVKLATEKAQNAWRAGGYITTLSFNYAIPHEKVNLENTSDGSIITLDLYWDDATLRARIVTHYSAYSSTIYPQYDYDTSVVRQVFDALVICNECEEKHYKVALPTSPSVSSFTIDTADGSLTCEASIIPTDRNSSTVYGCSKIRKCSDQQVTFNIESAQTFDFTLGQVELSGSFTTNITDTVNYRLEARYDSNTPISEFVFDYANGRIYMTFDGDYHGQQSEAVSVGFAEMMKDCETGNWIQCGGLVGQVVFTITNIPTN